MDVNIHTTEVDVKRTLNGIGTNLFYVRKGWLKPCPDDANDELINSYTTAVLFLNFISSTVDSVKRHAKGAYTIYQQGLASANLQFTDNPLDVERYISWDITTNNNKTYLTYHHYGHNGFSETCRYCVEDDSYDNVRVVNALNTRQTGDNPNATVNQFYLATNPTKDMHIATKQYVDTTKTEAQQLGLTTATPGQIIKVKAVQDSKPTEWEAVDMPSGEKWEKIKEITIAEGAEESNALTINADENGNTFRLKKARLCAKFPAYTGTSTIPNFSFAMINGKTTGRNTPLLYTSVWPKISTKNITGTIYYVDVSGAQQIEHAQMSGNSGWSDDTSRDYTTYGSASDPLRIMYGDTLWAKPITSIGGASMLIYPGCHFVLYGVRE